MSLSRSLAVGQVTLELPYPPTVVDDLAALESLQELVHGQHGALGLAAMAEGSASRVSASPLLVGLQRELPEGSAPVGFSDL